MSWIQDEAAQLELEAMESKSGLIPFWKVPVGITKIEVDITREPEESKFKDKKNVYIYVDGEAMMWSISRKSPLYRELINHLKNGKKMFNVVRVGETASDTRYSLVAL